MFESSSNEMATVDLIETKKKSTHACDCFPYLAKKGRVTFHRTKGKLLRSMIYHRDTNSIELKNPDTEMRNSVSSKNKNMLNFFEERETVAPNYQNQIFLENM